MSSDAASDVKVSGISRYNRLRQLNKLPMSTVQEAFNDSNRTWTITVTIGSTTALAKSKRKHDALEQAYLSVLTSLGHTEDPPSKKDVRKTLLARGCVIRSSVIEEGITATVNTAIYFCEKLLWSCAAVDENRHCAFDKLRKEMTIAAAEGGVLHQFAGTPVPSPIPEVVITSVGSIKLH